MRSLMRPIGDLVSLWPIHALIKPLRPVMGDEIDNISLTNSPALGSTLPPEVVKRSGCEVRCTVPATNGLRKSGVPPKPPAPGECEYRNIPVMVLPRLPILDAPVIDSPSKPLERDIDGLSLEPLREVRRLWVVVDGSIMFSVWPNKGEQQSVIPRTCRFESSFKAG